MHAFLSDEFPRLLIGLGNSVLVSAIGIVIGVALGAAFGAMRYAQIPVIDPLLRIYANLFRCTPLLVQVVMLYFALPDIGMTLTSFETAWLALALWGAAYHMEIFRSGFAAVSQNDVLAARALGMPRFQTFLDIVLPIGARTALPAVTTMAITQFRSSSFMIAIGYQELTYVANRMVSDTFKVFEIFGVAALCYLVICNLMSIVSRRLEVSLAVPGSGAQK